MLSDPNNSDFSLGGWAKNVNKGYSFLYNLTNPWVEEISKSSFLTLIQVIDPSI